MKKSLSILTAAIMIGFLGCGGGGGGDTASTTNTGTFIDAPVAGLSYETSSGIKGVTDSAGHFSYNDADTVTFKLGSVTLGKSVAHSVVTPYELSTHPEYIAYLLQNLDSDGNLGNGIQIPQDLPSVDVDLNDLTSIENALKTIKDSLKDKYTFPDISLDEAKSNLEKDTLAVAYEKIDNLNNKIFYVDRFTPFGTPIEAPYFEVKLDLDNGRFGVYDPNKKEWFEGDYIEKYDDFTLKTIDKDDPNDIVYNRFYKIDGGYLVMVVDINTKETKNDYVVLMNDLNSLEKITNVYTKTSNATRVTDEKEINQVFYKLDISSNGNLSTQAVFFDNGVAKKYYEDGNLTVDVSNNYDDDEYKFENGIFYNYSDEDGWEPMYVYKIPLKDKTLDINLLASENVFDNEDLVEYFSEHNLPMTYTFTKGYLYCTMLWWNCWFDKDGYEDLISQIKK